MNDMESWFRHIQTGEACKDIRNHGEFSRVVARDVRSWEEKGGCIVVSESIEWKDISNPKELTFVFWTLQPADHVRHKLDTIVQEYRSGVARISSHKVELVKILPHDAVSVELHFMYKLYIDVLACPHRCVTMHHKPTFDFSPRYHIGKYILTHTCEPIIVPLWILVCWMKGGIIDRDAGIAPELEQDFGIKYESKWYPKAVCDLFRTLGWTAFKHFVNSGALTKENAEILIYNLDRLGITVGQAEASTGKIDTASIAGDQVKGNNGLSVEEIIEALGLSKDDVKRVKEITKYEGRPRSNGKWAKALNFPSRSAPAGFFRRMEEKGLLVTTRGADGVGISVKLTAKGRRLI